MTDPKVVRLDRDDEDLAALVIPAWGHVCSGYWFGAYEDGRLVAAAALQIDARAGLAGLYCAFVSPEARGKGLHRALIEARLAVAVDAGCRLAAACVRPDNVASAANLKRLGFAACKPIDGVTLYGGQTLSLPLAA